jgi:hypothetical protein
MDFFRRHEVEDSRLNTGQCPKNLELQFPECALTDSGQVSWLISGALIVLPRANLRVMTRNRASEDDATASRNPHAQQTDLTENEIGRIMPPRGTRGKTERNFGKRGQNVISNYSSSF